MALGSEHLDSLREALKSEERFARAEHARVGALPAAERVTIGHTWTGVRLEQVTSMRHRELRVVVRGVLHEGIRSGDPVMVNDRSGRCVGWDIDAAELTFDRTDWDEVADATTVDLGFDASSWVRYRQALERADELESPLKTALLRGADAAESSRFDDRRGRSGEASNVEEWDGLNPSQQAAAQATIDGGPLSIIHGPPGTGKTRTLVALLKHSAGVRWALAESNAAVDNLALGASAAGLKVARVGPTFRMSGPVRDLSVDAQIEAGPHAVALKAIDRDISRAEGSELGTLFDQRRELQDQARDHVLHSADVIATTFGSLARRADQLPRADLAVVDEVTQAVEPAIWVAVPYVDRLVLAGDPHQLGPVVLEEGNALEVGILDRLGALGVPMPMLAEQHRMHGEIMHLVSNVYGDDYVAHDLVKRHTLAELDGVVASELTSAPVTFVDTTGMADEAHDPTSRSIFNEVEIRLVAVALRELLDAGVQRSQIGVVAPYSAQVARLAALPEAEGIEVATVNAFQGREAEAILMSFTRSNQHGELGFLSDRRRLTVAVTRARRFLWMCGDSLTLSRDPEFAELFDLIAMGPGSMSQSIWEPPWSAVLE